jgi:formate hydrogenlyase transcriptional activator
VVERAVILSRDGVLHVDAATLPSTAVTNNNTEQFRSEEREAIENALSTSHGKVAGENGAAKKLGLPASTLEFRIKKLCIDKFRYRKP